MEAISFINSTTYGTNMSGWNASLNGTVPGQVMADLEDGLWFGNKRLPPRPDMHAEFVTALVKGKGGDLFTLKGNKPACNRRSTPLTSLRFHTHALDCRRQRADRAAEADLQRLAAIRHVQRRQEGGAVRPGGAWVQPDEAPRRHHYGYAPPPSSTDRATQQLRGWCARDRRRQQPRERRQLL